jgi:uncharacterized membrane protein YkvA (DUF1232 family)
MAPMAPSTPEASEAPAGRPPRPPGSPEASETPETPENLETPGTPELDVPVSPADLAAFDADAAEREADAAMASGGEHLPHRDLLSFYDRLRTRTLDFVERRAGKLPEDAVIALLLVPDVFILLVRLVCDKEVPGRARLLIGGALAYFISPFDLLPEALLGPIGYLDDLVVAVAVLTQVFTGDLEPYARKHWTGRQDLQVVLRDVNGAARSLLGPALHDRLKRLLARHGVALGGPPPAGDGSGPHAPNGSGR